MTRSQSAPQQDPTSPEPETPARETTRRASDIAAAGPPRTDAPGAADTRLTAPTTPPTLAPAPDPATTAAPAPPRVAAAPRHSIVGRCIQRGRPAAGIEVRLDRTNSHDAPAEPTTPALASAVTDAEGAFALELVGDGPCQLTFAGSGTSRHQQPTRLAAGDIDRATDIQLGDIELTVAHSVVGRALNRDGRPAAATISTARDAPPLATADGDGRFVCDDVGPGPIELLVCNQEAEASIRVPAFATSTAPPSTTGTTTDSPTTASDDFDVGDVTLRVMITCAGSVVDDTMTARSATLRIVDPRADNPPTATATAAPTTPAPPAATTSAAATTVTTDPLGHFTLRAPADVDIVCEAAGCLPRTIPAADLARDARLLLPRSLALVGAIAHGNAHAEVRVQPVPGDDSPWLAFALPRCDEPIPVGADGSFRCDRLPPGRYTVVAVAIGSGASVAVDETVPQVTPVQLTLRSGRTVDLQIADDRAEPIAFAAIEVTTAAPAADEHARTTAGANDSRSAATDPDQQRAGTAPAAKGSSPSALAPAGSRSSDADPRRATAPTTTRSEYWRADAEGRATIALPPEAVAICVRPDHHLAASIAADAAVGTPTDPLQICCARSARLHGRIDDATDLARYDLAIAVWPADGLPRDQRERTIELELDRSGTFVADSVRPGRYNVALVRRDRTHRRAEDPSAADGPAPHRNPEDPAPLDRAASDHTTPADHASPERATPAVRTEPEHPTPAERTTAEHTTPADRTTPEHATAADRTRPDQAVPLDRAATGSHPRAVDHWTGAELPLLAAGVDSRAVALVTVTAAESTEIVVPVPPLATISGTVNQGPRPVPGVIVFAVPLGDPGNGFAGGWDAPGAAQLAPHTTTDAAGRFTFLVARPGRFEFRTRQPHQPFALPPTAASVSHYGDDITVTVTLPSGAIRGTMPRFAGDPVTIELRAAETNLHSVAAPLCLGGGDTFEFAPLPPGRYRIAASRRGQPLREWPVVATATTTDLGTLDFDH